MYMRWQQGVIKGQGVKMRCAVIIHPLRRIHFQGPWNRMTNSYASFNKLTNSVVMDIIQQLTTSLHTPNILTDLCECY